MNCKNCNRPLPDGKSFCEFCGKTVYEMKMLEEEEKKNKEKNKKKKIIIAASIVAACAVVAIAIFLHNGKNDKNNKSDLEYDSEFSVAKGDNSSEDDLSAKAAKPVEAPTPEELGEATAQSEETMAPGRLPYNEGDNFYKQVTHDKNGNLVIERCYGDIPMGSNNTWTIFVYMCGSDLESGYNAATGKREHTGGAASADIDEMIEASKGGNVDFVIETGGAKSWQKEFISEEYTGRFLISEGEVYYASDDQEMPKANMGESKTLQDFVKWGVKNYPAEKMGLVFWNHGGGSTSGVCFDENYGYDSLKLSEINTALYNASTSMTDRFEFIGFDACLMATLETADMCASYARYMYASEEVEPGWGWNYVGFGDCIDSDPSVKGDKLGADLCESYYDFYGQVDSYYGEHIQRATTLSAIDLDNIDYLTMAFDRYVGGLYEVTNEMSALADVARNVDSADRYGNGDFNLVDIGGLIHAGDMYNPYAETVLDALNDTVVAMKNGDNYSESSGLSIYYPICSNIYDELKEFAIITPSPYYTAFLQRMYYGSQNGGDISGYDPGDLLDEYETGVSDDIDDYMDQYGDEVSDGEGVEIEFDVEPQLTSDGYYGFLLTEHSLDYVIRVDAMIYLMTNDGEFIELGESGFVDARWDEGAFFDAFDGTWFSLPDGSALAAYLVREDAEKAVYCAPIILNGSDTYLMFTYINASDEFVINGIWDGSEEGGMAAHVNSLYVGDEITPRYYYYDSNGDYEGVLTSKYTYVVEKNMDISLTELNDNTDYYYQFTIYDIFGGCTYTDFTKFRREKGKIVFYPN